LEFIEFFNLDKEEVSLP